MKFEFYIRYWNIHFASLKVFLQSITHTDQMNEEQTLLSRDWISRLEHPVMLVLSLKLEKYLITLMI